MGHRLGRLASVAARAGFTAALVASTLAVSAPSASAADPAPNGLTSATAAASCWEIKQNVPAAASGTYWLVTPTLVAPEQFYCDMTTDGGGWVLVGRGREGWKTLYEGLGTTAQVRNPITGQAAFGARQLSSRVIDGLLDGRRVDALPDGVRLRRATNSSGTSWQEARFRFGQPRDRWVWTFPAEHRVGTYRFENSSGSGGQTNNFGSDQQFRRVNTTSTAAQGWTAGWAYGSGVAGTSSASTYLWSASNGLGAARPFTQVYLRPQLRLADLDFGDVPAAGLPEIERTPLAESGALPQTWGVTGLANGRSSELDTEVSAFAQVGNRIFVGGNFKYVQRGANASGADKVEQSYLAAFDATTGEWISTFRPTLNGQIKALTALPDGRLAIGGEFGQVNGTTARALAVISPTTGALDPSWTVALENRLSSGVLQVRSLSVAGSWLYLGGAFTHLGGGSLPNPTYARGAARVSVANGTPDGNWNPAFDGTVVSVDASDDGSRLYAAGYFASSNSQTATRAAAVRTVAGAPLATPAWNVAWSSGERANYQQAIRQSGDKVWVGGSEHSMYSFDTTTFQRLSGNITKNGGDFQAIDAGNGVVYGGCHCDDWNYSNAFTWSNVGSAWTQADKIGFVGAWDAATSAVVPDFDPVLKARAGLGAWAIKSASDGTLWVGGDFTSAIARSGTVQWVGGFMRFAARDITAPAAPSNLGATLAPDGVTLSWSPSSTSGANYEVVRNGRVLATTTATTLTVPASTQTEYVVRAADSVGNRSASTPVLDVDEPLPPSPVLIGAASTWSYRFDTAAVPASWREAGFDDSAWAAGPARLGYGFTPIGTNIDVPAGQTRPLTGYFRHSFEVADLEGLDALSLEVIADDGVAVYVNGVEAGRQNLPTGTLTGSTYASAAPRSAAAAANPVTFTVPASALHEGENVVSAEVHLNYRGSPDMSFDLTATRSEAALPAVAAPEVTVTATEQNAVTFGWEPGSGADILRFERAGEPVAEAPITAGELVVDGLEPETDYTWSVVRVGPFGRESAAVDVAATTAAAPVSPFLVTTGADWRWRFENTAVDPDWAADDFDDAAWPVGTAALGYGWSGLETVIDVPAGETRPLAGYFRTTFDVADADAAALDDLVIEAVADDGVAVYVNGVEVGRHNLPGTTLTSGTYASAAPRSATAAANPVSFDVPSELLVDGENVVSAEVHLNYRSSPDLSFDLSLEAR